MTSWRYEARSLALALCIVTIVLTTNLVQLQSLGLASCKPQTVARALGNGQGTARFDELARRAAAAREADRVDEAIGLYRRALRLRPSWDEGWWYLGTLYYDTNRYAEAVRAFGRVIRLRPQRGPGWALLGLCEFEVRDYKNSLMHLIKARQLGLAGNEELVNAARYHQALLMISNGEFEAAAELLGSLSRRGVNSDDLRVALGLSVLRVPLLPDQVDPSKDALIHAAGEASRLLALNDYEQAERQFRTLLDGYPNTPFIHYACPCFVLELFSTTYKYCLNRSSKCVKPSVCPSSCGDYAQVFPS